MEKYIKNIVIFLQPNKWWFYSTKKYKVYYVVLVIIIICLIGLFIARVLQLQYLKIFIPIVLVLWGLFITEFSETVKVYPPRLNFKLGNFNKLQKELHIENPRSKPVYSLQLFIDIGKLDFSDVDVSIPESLAVDANHYDPQARREIVIFNLLYNSRRYKFVSKRYLAPSFTLPLLVECKGNSTLKVVELDYKKDDSSIGMQQDGSTLTSPHEIKIIKKKTDGTLSGMKVTLMNI